MRLLGVLVVISAAGCFTAPATTARISCATSDDCPAQQACPASLHVCVKPGGDAENPSVVGLVVDPHVVRPGVSAGITFDASEPLGVDPQVQLVAAGKNAGEAALVDHTDLHYAYSVAFTGADTALDLVVNVTDKAGNQGRADFPRALVVDGTPPVLVGAAPAATAFHAGELVVYEIDASEPLAHAPVVSVTRDGVDVPGFFDDNVDTTDLRTVLTAASTLGAGDDGRYEVSITLEDEAHNVAAGLAGTGFDVDSTAPAFTAGPSADAASVNDVVTVRFSLDEAAATTAVTAGAAVFDPCVITGLDYVCSHTVDANDPEGTLVVVISVADAAGNRALGQVVVDVDRTPPTLVVTPQLVRLDDDARAVEGSSVFLTPSADSFAVVFTLSESSADTPVVVVDGAAAQQTSQAGLTYTFEADALSSSADHSAPIVASVVDAAGNTADLALGTAVFDATPPAPPAAAADGAVLVRAPWGDQSNASTFMRVQFPVPFLEDVTVDVLDRADTRLASVLARGDAADDGTVDDLDLVPVDRTQVFLRVRDRAGNVQPQVLEVKNGAWIGSLRDAVPNPHVVRVGGTISESGGVLNSGVDAVATARAHASLASADGDVVSASASALDTWVKSSARPHLSSGKAVLALQTLDGTLTWLSPGLVTRVVDDAWVETPAAFVGSTTATKFLRGGLVFPGEDRAWVVDGSNRVWEWRAGDGDFHFLASGIAAMNDVHDAAVAGNASTGELFLVPDSTSNAGTCRFDGTSWTQVAALEPPDRDKPNLTFDERRGELVVVGGVPGFLGICNAGCDDTWAFDGTAWNDLADTGGPHQATFFDPTTNALVAFFGLANGKDAPAATLSPSGWVPLGEADPEGDENPQIEAPLAYDAIHDVVVGVDTSDNRWLWNGRSWRLAPFLPPTSTPVSAAPDETRNTVLVSAAIAQSADPAFLDRMETLEWSAGARFVPIVDDEADGEPTTRTFGSSLFFDKNRNAVVLFGGCSTCVDTWEWTGDSWRDLAIASSLSPSTRTKQAVAFDEANDEAVLFGGVDGNELDDTWVFRTNRWVLCATSGTACTLTDSTTPPARHGAELAFDAAHNNVVLFGGESLNSPGTCPSGSVEITGSPKSTCLYHDTWIWDGAAWSRRSLGIHPSERFGHAMAFDASRNVVVLFGGSDTTGPLSDAWTWSGTAWAPLTVVDGLGDGSPPGFANAAMSVDPSTGGVLLVGDETWELAPAGVPVPGVVARFDVSSLGVTSSNVVSVDVTATAGGDSGASLFARTAAGAFASIVANASTTPAALDGAAPAAAIDDATASLAIRIEPVAHTATATVSADLLQVRVSYRRP